MPEDPVLNVVPHRGQRDCACVLMFAGLLKLLMLLSSIRPLQLTERFRRCFNPNPHYFSALFSREKRAECVRDSYEEFCSQLCAGRATPPAVIDRS